MKIVLVIVLLLAGIGGLLWLAMSGSNVAAATGLTVGDVLKGDAGKGQVKLKLQALKVHNSFNPVDFEGVDIAPAEIHADPAKLREFMSSAPRLRVLYTGHDKIPLEDYSHVSVTGTWDASKNVFHATNMTTQCPSHYSEQSTPKPQPMAAP